MNKIKTILLAFACSVLASTAFAQDIVKSAKIVEALTAKDIALDSATPARRPAGNYAASRRVGAIDLQVQFALNSSELLPVGQMQLDELAHALADRMLVADGIEITGHTDRTGDMEYNLRLSLDRAMAAKHYLVTRHGLSPSRLMTAGLGYSRLADPANPTAAVNRRVEIRRVALAPGYAMPAPLREPAPVTGGRIVPTPN